MKKILIAVLLIAGALLSGCSYSRHVQRRSNLMTYLDPRGDGLDAFKLDTLRLQLPLNIGIAFVPADTPMGPRRSQIRELYPPDAEKRLIDIVTRSFAGRDWVGKIQMIPSSYLVPRGGYANLEQIARLMGVDVIALVSVDQLQTSDPRRISFLYVSVIGAYTLPLDHNETRTLIDAAVFHVPTHTFLLRAPGVSDITGSSTAVDVDASLNERSYRGLTMAMDDLSKNLDREVTSFKESIATGQRRDVDIVTTEGKSVRQGGSFGIIEAILAALLACAFAVTRRP